MLLIVVRFILPDVGNTAYLRLLDAPATSAFMLCSFFSFDVHVGQVGSSLKVLTFEHPAPAHGPGCPLG